MIMRCTCQHPFQDKQYGVGMRVMNYAPKKNGYVCTVCKKLHGASDKDKRIEAKKREGDKKK